MSGFRGGWGEGRELGGEDDSGGLGQNTVESLCLGIGVRASVAPRGRGLSPERNHSWRNRHAVP